MQVTVKFNPTTVRRGFAPNKTSNFIPVWFKELKMPKVMGDRLNVKGCPAFVKGMTKGIACLAPADFIIVRDAEGNYHLNTPYVGVENHDRSQISEKLPNDVLVLKVNLDASFTSYEKRSFMYSYPTNFNIHNMGYVSGPSGFIDVQDETPCNCFLFIRMPVNTQVIIKAGEPLAIFYPLDTESLEVEQQEVEGYTIPLDPFMTICSPKITSDKKYSDFLECQRVSNES